MNPTGETTTRKPNMFKNIVKRTGGALGIQVAPMEQSTVATVVPDSVLSSVPTKSIDFNIIRPQADLAQPVAPIEQPVQPHIAEFTPSPDQSVPEPETLVESPPEVAEPSPAQSVSPLSADMNQPETSPNTVPEDPVATELISQNPELFIKDGVLDVAALKLAIEVRRIAENPKAQNLINQLREAGVVNSDVVSKLVQPILSELSRAA